MERSPTKDVGVRNTKRELFVFILVGELPYAEYLPAVGFAAGALLASVKYVLRIEYNHQDDTGVQWLTIAKSGKKTDKMLFDQHVAQLKRLLIS
ncbi:hypothetical protein [Salinivibrio sp. PR6]|uniref:hypothetical protein n=1 Tax=Salinivibrio sp. PR6 TaxID=1909485 RepID=UPI0010567D62|nr:hypothetical protein [Salinivibrio sp. PR6]